MTDSEQQKRLVYATSEDTQLAKVVSNALQHEGFESNVGVHTEWGCSTADMLGRELNSQNEQSDSITDEEAKKTEKDVEANDTLPASNADKEANENGGSSENTPLRLCWKSEDCKSACGKACVDRDEIGKKDEDSLGKYVHQLIEEASRSTPWVLAKDSNFVIECEDKDKSKDPLGCFGRFLSLWVLAGMIIGTLLGHFVPSTADAIQKAEVARVNLPISVLVWFMIFPMLLGIDFSSLKRIRRHPMSIIITSGVNYLVQPFLMFGLAEFFFRVVFRNELSSEDKDQFVAGCVILGGAPCTAMVFVWSVLTNGQPTYTVTQVAVNNLIMLAAYSPTVQLLIGVSSVPIPWGTLLASVGLFMLAPLLLAIIVRYVAHKTDRTYILEQAQSFFERFTAVALLGTVILIFIGQASAMVDAPLSVLMIACPQLITGILVFSLAYGLAWFAGVEFSIAAPGALIASSNFFELAVAIAIAVYGSDSGAALATVVGVLIEVPFMIALVKIANYSKPWFERTRRQKPITCGEVEIDEEEKQKGTEEDSTKVVKVTEE